MIGQSVPMTEIPRNQTRAPEGHKDAYARVFAALCTGSAYNAYERTQFWHLNPHFIVTNGSSRREALLRVHIITFLFKVVLYFFFGNSPAFCVKTRTNHDGRHCSAKGSRFASSTLLFFSERLNVSRATICSLLDSVLYSVVFKSDKKK